MQVMWLLLLQILRFGVTVVLVGLSACTGEAPVRDAPCTSAGNWHAEEERTGGDCAPGRLPAASLTVEIGEQDTNHRAHESDGMWSLQITRAAVPFTSCSGVPSDDSCRFEITCGGDVGEERGSYALTLEMSESGALTGSSVMTLRSEERGSCEAQFQLDGERVGPTAPLPVEESS